MPAWHGWRGCTTQEGMGHASLYATRAMASIRAQVNPPVGGTSAILADKVSDCLIDYDVANQRFGLLAVRLTLTSGGESVSLYNEVHVNNAP